VAFSRDCAGDFSRKAADVCMSRGGHANRVARLKERLYCRAGLRARRGEERRGDAEERGEKRRGDASMKGGRGGEKGERAMRRMTRWTGGAPAKSPRGGGVSPPRVSSPGVRRAHLTHLRGAREPDGFSKLRKSLPKARPRFQPQKFSLVRD